MFLFFDAPTDFLYLDLYLVVFLSLAEAMAALEAGMMSIVVDRKEKLNNVLLAKKDSANREEVPVVNSFDEIQFQ